MFYAKKAGMFLLAGMLAVLIPAGDVLADDVTDGFEIPLPEEGLSDGQTWLEEPAQEEQYQDAADEGWTDTGEIPWFGEETYYEFPETVPAGSEEVFPDQVTILEGESDQSSQSYGLTEDEIQAMNGGGAVIVRQNDKVTLIDGRIYDGQITDFQTASRAVQGVCTLLGMDSTIVLQQNGSAQDRFGNRIWRFSQVLDAGISGQGMIKLFTDASGMTTGLVSSVLLNGEQSAAGSASEKEQQYTNIQVQDEEAVFSGMTTDIWTGAVSKTDGSRTQISIPVMRDSQGNAWLGDMDRKILAVDYYTCIYQGAGLVPLAESEWDDQLLLIYASFIQAYDFYKALGWNGPDGSGAPLLILWDSCSQDRSPSADDDYIGKLGNWEAFAVRKDAGTGQALDLTGNLYTHSILNAAVPDARYANEFGSICEGLCDIMGNIMEMLTQRTEDTTWLVGEKTGQAVRSMSHPGQYGQPEYTGDLYYLPVSSRPGEVNDQGGIHVNSSLLSMVAAALYDAGMATETQRDYWNTVLLMMTPETDFLQMTVLLPLALKQAALTDYWTVLQQTLADIQMGFTGWTPQQPKEGCALIQMAVPDLQIFKSAEPVLKAVPVQDQESAFLSYEGEAGIISLMVTPGTYELYMVVPDAWSSDGTPVMAAYDGMQWFTDLSKAPFQAVLEEGDAVVLSGEGLTSLNEKAGESGRNSSGSQTGQDLSGYLPAAPAQP